VPVPVDGDGLDPAKALRVALRKSVKREISPKQNCQDRVMI
jgi:hypothetical protein